MMLASTLPSLQHPTLDNTVGAIFLGALAAMFLFGITTLQMCWYYHLYPKDSSLHKWSVALLWTLDTFHVALTIHAVYTYLVTGYGSLTGLQHIIWSIKLQVSVNVVIILVVHGLYAHRVWILGNYHRGMVGYLVALVVTGGFAIGIILAYRIYTIHTYADLDRVSWIIVTALATSTGIDFIITGGMCYYLRKSQVPASRLNSWITTIMQYMLGSGLFTSACSLSTLFCYVLLPNTLIFLGLEFLLTKLYVVSFLTMLNARKRAITMNTTASHDPFSESKTSSGTPMTDLVRRGCHKSHSDSSQCNKCTRRRTHKRLRTPQTSSFWSPEPKSFDYDRMQGRNSDDDLERGVGESETAQENESMASINSPVVQVPPSVHYTSINTSPQLSPVTPISITGPECRPSSSSYPWHAR